MHKTSIVIAAAATLFAAGMGASGSAAAGFYPTTPCTAQNEGTIEIVDNSGPNGYGARMFQCDSGRWELIGYCDIDGCFYY